MSPRRCGIHIAFAQHRDVRADAITVSAIALGNCSSYSAISIHHCTIIQCNFHIVQQEAEAIVAKSKLNMRIVILSQLVNDSFYFADTEIFTAAIQMENPEEAVVARITSHNYLFFLVNGVFFRFLRRLRRRLQRRFSRLRRRFRLLHRLFTHDRLPRIVRKRRHRQQFEHHREQQPYKKTLRILTRSGSVHFILFLSLKVRVMGYRPSLHKSDNSQCYFTGTYFTAFTM